MDDNALLKEEAKRQEEKKDNAENIGHEEKVKDKGGRDLFIPKKVKQEKHPKQHDMKPQTKVIPSLLDSTDLVDITDQVAADENKLLDDSSENEEEKLRQTQMAVALNLIEKAVGGEHLVLGTRPKKTWPAPPPYPMRGPDGTSLMRKGLVPSKAIYDPLGKVDHGKMEKLREYLRSYDYIPLADKKNTPEDVLLYRELITPRKYWPDPTFGWLASEHLKQFLRLLQKRSLNVPSPFYTDRIAFIDPWFACMWVKDYKQWSLDPKKWKFTQSYLDLANGKSPADMPSNKKWYLDVDLAYLVHQVNGDHWVTLEIDFAKEKIDCYDSIIGEGTPESDKLILEQCRVFTRMVPALLNKVIPTTMRKPSNQQFKFRRKKGIPQNKQVGDCGVYSLKYIEMLVLGVGFEGLNDDNMQWIREKMGAEIYDEVGNMYAQFL